jgi:hypothetical protein
MRTSLLVTLVLLVTATVVRAAPPTQPAASVATTRPAAPERVIVRVRLVQGTLPGGVKFPVEQEEQAAAVAALERAPSKELWRLESTAAIRVPFTCTMRIDRKNYELSGTVYRASGPDPYYRAEIRFGEVETDEQGHRSTFEQSTNIMVRLGRPMVCGGLMPPDGPATLFVVALEPAPAPAR